jgi:hypothetical protein
MLGQVAVVRRSRGHGTRRRYLDVRSEPLADIEVVEVDGLVATSIERPPSSGPALPRSAGR